ncbi:hypothetical protein CWI84_08235 [Idiomarina tyrosinivorans]|uniref:Uncharacterized protein n=1 Tax=Idiomarina tyrosinivorans TaxID=1445662 RepID=A0A432ZQ30_9GAMM|nr:carbohydrate porin [Idiomarina tyrosinivorans]RUO79938.1 hypothetical protein CWI84_08235 [Idiomarina tyrosinivorans]
MNARYQLSKAVNAKLGFSHDRDNAWLAQLQWRPFRGANWTVGGREGQPYAIVEQHWLGYSGQWGVFAQYGHNDTPVLFHRHRSVGITWQRHDHEFGLATSWVKTVAEQLDERAYEIYWRAKITDWLALQPDIQWLDQRRKSLQRGQDSTILTLRLAMNW